ncbi:hypothetical protein ACP4OV_002251 [Aristida adscensionis]
MQFIMTDNSAIAPAEGRHLQSPQTMVGYDPIEEPIHNVITEQGLEQCNGETRNECPYDGDYFWKLLTKIHKFPASLIRFGIERDYITPRTVAMGPYHHGKPELQVMEQVKRKAAENLFQGLDELQKATRNEVICITQDIRSCYADADMLVPGIPDDKFADMMFIDCCFLVQLMEHEICPNEHPSWLRSVIQQQYKAIKRDIMLLENQIPWVVFKIIMHQRRLPIKKVTDFLLSCFPLSVPEELRDYLTMMSADGFSPAHLLGLLLELVHGNLSVREDPIPAKALPVTTSASELVEMGVKLKASSKTTLFQSMNTVKGPFFAELSLAPLALDDISACCLANMVAFEICTAIGSAGDR